MAKFQISWMESKTTSTGKNKHDLTLQGEDGTTGDNITMWGDFPGFSDFKPGSTVEGDIVTKVNGQYTNKTIYPIKPKVASGGQTGGFKGNMNKMMEKKAEYIEKAQERKNDSIAFFNATNSAIAITTALMKNDPENNQMLNIESEITRWRTWFLKEWENYNEKAPF